MEKNTLEGLSSQGKIDPLYSKVQIIYLKCKEKEERQRELRITIELHTGIGPLGRQVLGIKLTDDEDPYFLCSLLVTEEDFKSLKIEQGLLVDFDHFPSQLVRLLEECVSSRDKTGSRFHLILNEDSNEHGLPRWHTSLQFVETNEFKHLCHLSLKILSGSDNEIKKHMATKIKNLKDDLASTANVLEQKNQMLSVAYEKLEAKNQELEESRVRVGDERTSLERKVLHEAAEAREALSKAHLEWQRRLEKERQELEETRGRDTRALEEQLSELKRRNQLLSEKLLHTETSVRELAKHADSAERELKSAQRDIATLRKQNSQIDMDYHEKEKVVNTLRTKFAVLEQEMKDRNLLFNKQQELLQVSNEQKVHLEETIIIKDAALETKQISLKSISDDLVKANEIIAKQFSDTQKLKSKLKLRTEIAMKQESILSGRDKEVAELIGKTAALESRVHELESANKEVQEALLKSKEELENKDKAIKNNENVITWLTRQVKEAQVNSNSSARSGFPNLLTSSLTAPTTSTPNIGATPASLLAHSSVHSHETSAELFLQKQKDNIRNLAGLRQRLGLPDSSSMLTSEKQKPTLVPLQEETDSSRKSSLISGSGNSGRLDIKSQPARSKAGNVRPPKPARHTPTSTTPVVKRSDILSSYFPKS